MLFSCPRARSVCAAILHSCCGVVNPADSDTLCSLLRKANHERERPYFAIPPQLVGSLLPNHQTPGADGQRYTGVMASSRPKHNVIIGGVLLHLALGTLYSWGCVQPYVTSYIRWGDHSLETHDVCSSTRKEMAEVMKQFLLVDTIPTTAAAESLVPGTSNTTHRCPCVFRTCGCSGTDTVVRNLRGTVRHNKRNSVRLTGCVARFAFHNFTLSVSADGKRLIRE